MNIEELIAKNQSFIDSYAKIEDVNNLNKHLLIARIIKNKKCFFSMEHATAISILSDLKIEEPEKALLELINFDNYDN